MSSAIRSILRPFTRKIESPLNILLFNLPHHEKYNYLLSQTGHNFYLWTEQFATWSFQYLAKPNNFFHLPPSQDRFDNTLDFDLVVCHDRFNALDMALNVAHGWHLNLIVVHHDCLGGISILDNGLQGNIQKNKIQAMIQRQGHINIFDSDEVSNSWQSLGKVIRPGINTEFFTPKLTDQRSILWQPTRDPNLNNFVVQQLGPHLVPMQPSYNLDMLRDQYQNAGFYLNLNGVTLGIDLLEAGACGLPIIGVKNPYVATMYSVNHINQLNSLLHMTNSISESSYKEESGKQRERILVDNNVNFINDWKYILTRIINSIYMR